MIDVFHPEPPRSSLVALICRCAGGHDGAEHARRAEQSAREDASYARQEAQKKVDAATAEAQRKISELAAQSPDPDRYEIVRVERYGQHLVMQVKYPSCTKCEFEGLKTMVFLKTPEANALRWRRIDPHFRAAPKTGFPMNEAPSPAARFPGNEAGWADAIDYIKRKAGEP